MLVPMATMLVVTTTGTIYLLKGGGTVGQKYKDPKNEHELISTRLFMSHCNMSTV